MGEYAWGMGRQPHGGLRPKPGVPPPPPTRNPRTFHWSTLSISSASPGSLVAERKMRWQLLKAIALPLALASTSRFKKRMKKYGEHGWGFYDFFTRLGLHLQIRGRGRARVRAIPPD
jgi:hypothetical protein